jgi:ketol-acid reductoisomerase
MKTLRSILLGLSLLTIVTAAKASKPEAAFFTTNHAINTYIDAITRGRLDGFNDVLEPTAKFSMLRGKQVLSFSKEEMLNFLGQNKNVEQVCTTSTSIVESNADITVVKVDMHYDNFIRSNYVTIANTGNGWKITNVYSVFK